MPSNFSEFTRVQIPALLHLERLGYHFVHHRVIEETDIEQHSSADIEAGAPFRKDDSTNILQAPLHKAIHRLNPDLSDLQIEEHIRALIRIADNDDLGREFYQRLLNNSDCRLIDFDNPDNNTYLCTIELECENTSTRNHFRPDITVFINGLPLVQIEVKKPQNREGMLAERARMNERMQQRDFRRFLNIAQLMIFSNNEEYDNESRVPVQGAFYATISKPTMFFNVFREAQSSYYDALPLATITEEREKNILTQLGKSVLYNLPEYGTNKCPTTPTNRLLSSLLAKERILFLLKYGFAYVNTTKKDAQGNEYQQLEKHVMRYPQFFANRAICKALDKNVYSGTIWHTQGSGKTALAFFAVKILNDYFAKRNAVARFYFIVDRISLMEQAMREFDARGLKVFTAQNRRELMADLANNANMRGNDGQLEITVVNIQRFDEQRDPLKVPQYNTNIQRVFFVDEAHRGYNVGGSFLANLLNADTHAVRIALTGTPLLKQERETWRIFGNYLDKYYYDKSIADGFTLRLMREEIETDYKDRLLKILEQEFPDDIQVNKKDITKDIIIQSDNYVNTLVEFVTKDLIRFRQTQADNSVAGMLVCETNPQARRVKELFDAYQATQAHPLHAELILHDEGEAEDRKRITDSFKDNTDIDILIVNKMLLTGFDAHRLKRLYLTRKMEGHDLLQALTRVNRPYKEFRYGYVIDFAGIRENFEEANDRYIHELNACDEDDTTSDENRTPIAEIIMASKDEILDKIQEIKQKIFAYDCSNAEELRLQLEQEDIPKENLLDLRNTLEEAKALTNELRTYGDTEVQRRLVEMEASNANFANLLAVVNDRVARINEQEKMEHSEDVHDMVNYILSEMQYQFVQKSKDELRFIWDDEMQDKLREVFQEFESNFDNEERQFKDLLQSFKKYYREKGFKPQSRQEIKERVKYLDEVMKVLRDINHKNMLLKHKLSDDERYVRVYKRIDEQNALRSMTEPFIISKVEMERVDAINHIRKQVELILFEDQNVIQNEAYFSQEIMARVSTTLRSMNLQSNRHDRAELQRLILREYTSQYQQIRIAC